MFQKPFESAEPSSFSEGVYGNDYMKSGFAVDVPLPKNHPTRRVIHTYTVPNQKVIICDSWEGSVPSGETYTLCVHSIECKARCDLSGNGYKLYRYLSDNKKGFRLALSPVAVRENTGMGKAAYDNAVRELQKKGYLCPEKGKTLLYRFTIIPVPASSDDRATIHSTVADCPLPDDSTTGNMMTKGWSPDDRTTCSTTTGWLSYEDPMTGSAVTGGEINTNNKNIHPGYNTIDMISGNCRRKKIDFAREKTGIISRPRGTYIPSQQVMDEEEELPF